MDRQVVSTWLQSVLTPYTDSSRTYSDIMTALDSLPSLSPRTELYISNVGQTSLLVQLRGTVPIQFKGNTYNIPVEVWIPKAYPRQAPMCYVTPTAAMNVRKTQDVELDGLVVGGDYVAQWERKWETKSLLAFIQACQESFARQPPVYAKPKDAGVQPPSRSGSMSAAGPASSAGSASPATNNKPPPPLPGATPPPAQSPGPPLRPPKPGEQPSRSASVDYSYREQSQPQQQRYSQPPPQPAQHQYQHQPAPQQYHQQQHQQQQHQQQYEHQRHPPLQYHQHPHPQQLQSPHPPASPYVPNGAYTQPQSTHPQHTQHTQPQHPEPTPAPPRPPRDLLSDQGDDEEISAQPLSTTAIPPGPAPARPPNPELYRLHLALHAKLTSRVSSIQTSLQTSNEHLRVLSSDLDAGPASIQDELARLTAVREVCKTRAERLEATLDSTMRRVDELDARPQPPPAEIVLADSIVGDQLVSLLAADLALTDTLYHLSRAMQSEQIDLERYLKWVRLYGREQFLKRALARKIRIGLDGA